MILDAIDPRGVASVVLDCPERHNALDDAMVASLTATLDRLGKAPDVRVVVLRGSGPSFCAGADLGWMQRMATASLEDNVADARSLARLMQTLDRLAKPTLALVQGPAFGGGVGLVACCDIAVASEAASFRLSEVRLGLMPATIAPAVVRAVGLRQARRYVLTAEPLSAARARDLGLVHEVVPADALAGAGEAIVAALLDGAPGAQADAKDLLFLCDERGGDPAIGEATSRRIALRRASEEGREGLAAFFARRPPAWRNPAWRAR